MASEELDFETALRKVIAELKAPKSQRNTFGNYNYRNAEDIQEAAKPLLDKYKLRMKMSDEIVHFPSTNELQTVELIDSKGKRYTEIIGGDRYYVKSTVTVTGYGAEDSTSALAREEQNKKGMDGAQVTGAASSYARKYALNGMFDIDDTKDADTSAPREQTSRAPKKDFNPAWEKQEQTIRALAAMLGYSEKVIDAKIATVQSSDDAKNMIAKLEQLNKESENEQPKEPF